MLKMSYIQQRWGLIAASKIYHGCINYCVYPINYSLLLVKYIIWEWTTIFTEIVKEKKEEQDTKEKKKRMVQQARYDTSMMKATNTIK